MAEMIDFEFEGNTYQADASVMKDYRVMKGVACVATNPAGFFAAYELIFAGKDEEYAEMLGGSVAKMGELSTAAFEAAGAKNS